MRVLQVVWYVVCVCGLVPLMFGCTHVGVSLEPHRIHPATTLPASTPWNLEILSEAPGMTWLDEEGPIRSLLYSGEEYKGQATEVFAYYASPSTLKNLSAEGHQYPAVVLVHGGGGTVFKDWVQLWAERGYAAIAMDLGGRGENKVRLVNGGPEQDDDSKFGQIHAAVNDKWTYHAVANVIRAHSLIRRFDEVDAERTAITGISWGGYLTCIVSGLDSRFKAAVPVYGSGFLHEDSVWLPRFEQMTSTHAKKWVQLWDPSMYVGSASMPVFFVNGTNDFAYWLESYEKTYRLVKGERNLRITVKMPHGHQVGWAPKEIGLFIDQYLIDGYPLPKVERPGIVNGKARAKVNARSNQLAAMLHYTVDEKDNKDREWVSVIAHVEGFTIEAEAPPAEAKIWFFTVLDNQDALVSSELVFTR